MDKVAALASIEFLLPAGKCLNGQRIFLQHGLQMRNCTRPSLRALDLMLERNYIGIPISAAVLTCKMFEMFKLLSGQPNQFSICMENLRANWNPDPQNSIEAVRFMKNLYSSTVLVLATRQQIVSLVFSSVVVGLSPQRAQLRRLLLASEFKLMGLTWTRC
jgi:hypothetical protein